MNTLRNTSDSASEKSEFWGKDKTRIGRRATIMYAQTIETAANSGRNISTTGRRLSNTSASPAKRTTARKRADRGHAHHPQICVCDKRLVARARDPYAGVWMLEVAHNGEVSLKLGGTEVAFMSAKQGSALLNTDGCPFIRAADMVAAVVSGLALVVSDVVRADLEFGLARWIPLYFDL